MKRTTSHRAQIEVNDRSGWVTITWDEGASLAHLNPSYAFLSKKDIDALIEVLYQVKGELK